MGMYYLEYYFNRDLSFKVNVFLLLPHKEYSNRKFLIYPFQLQRRQKDLTTIILAKTISFFIVIVELILTIVTM